jgi:ATP-binding cassette subfamily B protein
MFAYDSNWWRIAYRNENDKPLINRAVLKRVYAYARPYARQIIFILFCIGGNTALSMLPPLLTRRLIDITLPQGNYNELHLLVLTMIGISAVGGVMGVTQRMFSAEVGEGVIRDLRQALYAHLQQMALRFFTNTKTGELMARLNNDVVGAQRAITSTLINLITDSITFVATLAIMFSLEWRLTLGCIVLLPLFILPARRMGPLLRQATRDGMNANAQMNAQMNETLNVSGMLLLKLFGRQKEMQTQFNTVSQQVASTGLRSATLGRWFGFAIDLVAALGTAFAFWLGGVLVLQGVFTVGTVVAFAAYLARLYGPFSSLASARLEFATALVSFERVFEVLDLPLEIRDAPDAIELPNPQGAVTFENVSFRYSDLNSPSLSTAERVRGYSGEVGLAGKLPDYQQASTAGREWAVQDISFNVQPGQLVALVGPSGAGKTTLTYLLPRLYDPSAGRILIDGIDLRQIRLSNLVEQIGAVTQETYLFHDTVRANLLYARPDASQADLEQACHIANIYDHICSLPQGFDTVVGERGYRFSGGEKQRIAIARAVLKNPKILILDEATSALDSQSEALIQAALQPLMRGRTSLVIAHRLSTILAADLILVIEQGKLVESGKHAELLTKQGLYAKLYETQFRLQSGQIS